MKKDTEFQVGRDGEMIGLFSCVTALSKASVGTLRPSDYAYIIPRSKGSWVHLYKVLKKVYDREFFDELGESELDKELKAETQKAKEFLNLYKKAFAKETDKKKLKEFCAKIVEYEELLKHLSGIKERILTQKAEWEEEEKRDLEEDQKAIEAEMKEKVDNVVETLKGMIEEAKKDWRGTYVQEVPLKHMCFDWWWDYKDVLLDFCKSKTNEKTGESLWKAFRRIKLYKGELTALAEKIVKAKENTDADKGEKEAERIFFAFLNQKGVWVK